MRFLVSPNTTPNDIRFQTLLTSLTTIALPVPPLSIYIRGLCTALEDIPEKLPLLNTLTTTFFGISAPMWRVIMKPTDEVWSIHNQFESLLQLLDASQSDESIMQMILQPATKATVTMGLGNAFCKGDTLLHWWVLNCHVAMHSDEEDLIQKRAEVIVKCFQLLPPQLLNLPNDHGVTPLMIASLRAPTVFLDLLLQVGPDAHLSDFTGRTAWDYVDYEGDDEEEVEGILRTHCKDLTLTNRKSRDNGFPKYLHFNLQQGLARKWFGLMNGNEQHLFTAYYEVPRREEWDVGDLMDFVRMNGEWDDVMWQREAWVVVDERARPLEGLPFDLAAPTPLQKSLQTRVRIHEPSDPPVPVFELFTHPGMDVYTYSRIRKAFVVYLEDWDFEENKAMGGVVIACVYDKEDEEAGEILGAG
ncbi:hypothetical protein HK097_001668, partial [Rhizophlyctis rosea]